MFTVIFPRSINLLTCLACASLLAWAGSSSPPKLDTAWKKYVNKDVGYCVDYPSRWARGEAFDGAGMYFETGVKKFSRPLGEIDIGALPQQQSGAAGEYLQIHLQGLRKFERAERLEVLDTHEITLLDGPALFTKDRYFDPLDRAMWVDEIVLAKHGDLLFRLELVCRADQVARFEPVFSHFVNTFKFECNAKR
jgi:hypothetical protein